MKDPKDLPNIDGYKFIGFTDYGSNNPRKCRVVRDKNGTHYVDGEAKYCELVGWVEAEE